VFKSGTAGRTRSIPSQEKGNARVNTLLYDWTPRDNQGPEGGTFACFPNIREKHGEFSFFKRVEGSQWASNISQQLTPGRVTSRRRMETGLLMTGLQPGPPGQTRKRHIERRGVRRLTQPFESPAKANLLGSLELRRQNLRGKETTGGTG